MWRKKNSVISDQESKTQKCSWKLRYLKKHLLSEYGISKGILKIADPLPMNRGHQSQCRAVGKSGKGQVSAGGALVHCGSSSSCFGVSVCFVFGRHEELFWFGTMHEESSHFQWVSNQWTVLRRICFPEVTHHGWGSGDKIEHLFSVS